MPKFNLSRVLIAAAVATGLTLGGVVPAHAATPSLDDLIAKYGHGGLTQSTQGTYVTPNVRGLSAKRYTTLGAASAATPDTYSLKAYTVPVGDQGSVNSCVAWTLGYSMLGWYSRYLTGATKAYAPMYIFAQDMVGDNVGSTVQDGYDILGTQGIVQQADYQQGNYDYRTQPTGVQTAAAVANKVTAPHWLYDMNNTGGQPGAAARTAIEAAISSKHPVALSIPLYTPFYYLTANNSVLRGSQITGNDAVADGGHEVLIVGYDNTGVIIQNQWGTGWGDGGFATLDWAFVQQFSLDASWIYGFQRDFNQQQVPAAVNTVTVTPTSTGGTTTDVRLSWHATGAFDDAVTHPVTAYNVNLSGTNGWNKTYSFPAAGPRYTQRANFTGLANTVTYTLKISATNAIGTGPETSYAFTPGQGVAFGPTVGADTPSPAMPAAAPQPTQATPVNNITPPTNATQTTTPVRTPPQTTTPSKAPTAPTVTNPTPQPTNAQQPGVRKPVTKPGNTRASVKVVKRKHTAVRAVATWRAPKATGNRPISTYRIKVVGTKAGHVKYRHTFMYGAKTRHAIYRFTGKNHLRHGLAYKVIITVKNAAGKWGTSRTTTVGRL